MQFWIATARPDDLAAARMLPLAGVYADSDAVAATGRPWRDALSALVAGADGREIHVPAHGESAQEITAQAEALAEIIGAEHLVLALPIAAASLEAMTSLADRDIPFNVIGVATVAQGLLALKAGADFVSVLTGRVAEAGGDADLLISMLVEAAERDAPGAQIIAADIDDAETLALAAGAGAHGVVIAPSLLTRALDHPISAAATARDREGWESMFKAAHATPDA